MKNTATLLTALTLAAMTAGAARAGESAAAVPFRFETKSLVFARYASVNASALFAGYGFGRAGVFFAAADNPRSGYHELISGVLTRVAREGESLVIALAAADTSDGDYLQLYVAPSLTRGSVSFDGTAEVYEPLKGSGSRQLDLNPLTVLWRTGGNLSLGVSSVASFNDGGPSRYRAGPMARLEIPPGAVAVEWLAAIENAKDEVRVTFQASF